MDDGADLPSQFFFSHPEMPDATFDDLLSDATTCTHTHTCNPPGPSAAMHTHTCLHAHTQVLAGAGSEDDGPAKPRRPLGNREAVRKYREKKKAHAAFLEEEVKKLRAANQQLLRRLQGHAALEAEVVRLRGLIFDVRAKIDAEVGAFPFHQKQCSVGSVSVACADPTLCFNGSSEAGGVWEECSRTPPPPPAAAAAAAAAAADVNCSWSAAAAPGLGGCKIDEDGNCIMSREIGVSQAVDSMDVVDLSFPT